MNACEWCIMGIEELLIAVNNKRLGPVCMACLLWIMGRR